MIVRSKSGLSPVTVALAAPALAFVALVPSCEVEHGSLTGDGGEAEAPIDDSPALVGDAPVRTLCGERCHADCQRLIECGRYEPGEGYSACVAECTGPDGRYCVTWTFDSFCPLEVYGPDRVITRNEKDLCLSEARSAECWCATDEDCWDPAMPMPVSCTAAGLCDPR